jgi:excisionase family DNA binding protein
MSVEAGETFIGTIRQRRSLMSVKDLAQALGVNPYTIYRLAKRSRIPVIRIGYTLRFDPQMIANWLELKSVVPSAKIR